ncbi:phosphodiesterase [Tissierella creatinini]|nr:phosphodiesterase [Tissierella creatinini]TJX59654.1 phosphodiesterase [Soehngenia saccharolytica]
MKLFFISDIHGSIYYLKKALKRFEEEKADYIVILGDILYHGARNPLPLEYNPKEVFALLNSIGHKIIAVRGNCDSEVDEMVVNFPIMATYSNILYNNRRVFITHGHIYNETNMPPLADSDMLIQGHTHIPRLDKKDNVYVVNPGSITLPKEDNPHTFGILEGSSFKIKTLEGEIFKEIIIIG